MRGRVTQRPAQASAALPPVLLAQAGPEMQLRPETQAAGPTAGAW